MGIRYYYWILLIFTASKFNVMPLIDKLSQSTTECMMLLKSHHCQVMLHQARSRITTEAEAMSFQTWCNQFQNMKVKPKPALLRFADANTLKFQLTLGMRSQHCLCLLWFMQSSITSEAALAMSFQTWWSQNTKVKRNDMHFSNHD